ncbi:hydrogenase iron-sulfur subunit [bacterium]
MSVIKKEDFCPKIIAFCCNWCSYAGSDLAGISRLNYDAELKIIRVPCSGRIDPIFIIKAFHTGADGVMVAGCHPGDCHYTTGNYFARRRMLVLKELLKSQGIEEKRLVLTWISASEAVEFAKTAEQIVNDVKELGPLGR